MRTLVVPLLVLSLEACATDTLDNTAYRRLVDHFDTHEQCLADGNFAACYQTLTFCANATVNANLDVRAEGHYQLKDSDAVAQLPTMTVIFDLEHLTSEQLPGRHAWELVTPLQYDCQ